MKLEGFKGDVIMTPDNDLFYLLEKVKGNDINVQTIGLLQVNYNDLEETKKMLEKELSIKDNECEYQYNSSW